jgi:hypothetical protein
MRRLLDEQVVVVVRFIYMETKQMGELVHLPGKMARYPGGAIMVELGENMKVEDSQDSRDQVEMKLEGNVELVFGQDQDRVLQVRVAGDTVFFEFNDLGKKIVKAMEDKKGEDVAEKMVNAAP